MGKKKAKREGLSRKVFREWEDYKKRSDAADEGLLRDLTPKELTAERRKVLHKIRDDLGDVERLLKRGKPTNVREAGRWLQDIESDIELYPFDWDTSVPRDIQQRFVRNVQKFLAMREKILLKRRKSGP